ncbi:MAG: hypothetical protein SV375_13710 [Thermodesulfobacteriota bacterium]|nr:hypothetical protein [Thermodesulfobacteriota bacterium]
MKTIEQLKTEYDNKSIKAIEKEAKDTQGQAKDVYVRFIDLLFYLERTARFKENPLYKTSRFQQYLSFEYGIRYTTYHEDRLAHSNFPEFSRKYTPQLVKSIKVKCGSNNVAKVIREIETKDTGSKKPITRDAIQDIINKNRKPEAPKPVKLDPKVLENRLAKSQKAVKELASDGLSKDRQIAKLKETVKRLKAENERLKKENNELKALAGRIAEYVEEGKKGINTVYRYGSQHLEPDMMR